MVSILVIFIVFWRLIENHILCELCVLCGKELFSLLASFSQLSTVYPWVYNQTAIHNLHRSRKTCLYSAYRTVRECKPAAQTLPPSPLARLRCRISPCKVPRAGEAQCRE